MYLEAESEEAIASGKEGKAKAGPGRANADGGKDQLSLF
jgi:hypothetical protein